MLEIIAQPRSGSTYLQTMLWAYINETSNPLAFDQRQISPQKYLSDAEMMLFKEDLLKSSLIPVIKEHPRDYKSDWDSTQKIYLVRRNHFETVLSHAIATTLGKWSWEKRSERSYPVYLDTEDIFSITFKPMSEHDVDDGQYDTTTLEIKRAIFNSSYDIVMNEYKEIMKKTDDPIYYEDLTFDPQTDYKMVTGIESPHKYESSLQKTPDVKVTNLHELEKLFKIFEKSPLQSERTMV